MGGLVGGERTARGDGGSAGRVEVQDPERAVHLVGHFDGRSQVEGARLGLSVVEELRPRPGDDPPARVDDDASALADGRVVPRPWGVHGAVGVVVDGQGAVVGRSRGDETEGECGVEVLRADQLGEVHQYQSPPAADSIRSGVGK